VYNVLEIIAFYSVMAFKISIIPLIGRPDIHS